MGCRGGAVGRSVATTLCDGPCLCKMSGPGGFSMNLSRAGTKPNSLGLQGAAGLQRKPAGSAPTPISSLSLPKKKPGGLAKPMAPAAGFGGDDDSGDDLDDDAAERKRMLQRGGMGGGGFAGSAASRAAIEQAKREALEQDASAFDYDGVYDSMQQGVQHRARRPRRRASQRRSRRRRTTLAPSWRHTRCARLKRQAL